MAAYLKRIALIKTLNSGYSSDGGSLKGIVRCEAYGGQIRVECTLINFAPLAEGAYRAGICDGQNAILFTPPTYQGSCNFDLADGFACLVAFCRAGQVVPIASAVCGDNHKNLALLQAALGREESPPAQDYNDEAIAEDNYYELEADKNGGAVCPPQGQGQGSGAGQNEDDAGAGQVAQSTGADGQPGGADGQPGQIKCATTPFRIGGSPQDIPATTQEGQPGESEAPARYDEAAQTAEQIENSEISVPDYEAAQTAKYAVDKEMPAPPQGGGAGRADFYVRMRGDIKNILETYPRAPALEGAINGSRWAKISYGSGAHYAFGVIYYGGNARYICYGVPVAEGAPCPPSLADRAQYIPVQGGGYWVMYQDAQTGKSELPRE